MTEQNEAQRLADALDTFSNPWDKQAAAELRRLEAAIERERMRLAACDVIACADTPETAVKARQMHEDYKGPAFESVARRVDECIKLRAVNAQLLEALETAFAMRVTNHREWEAIARAAIAKATGESK
jgi:hypothetical protein